MRKEDIKNNNMAALDSYAGEKEPCDEKERPILLSEEQIKALIENKKQISGITLSELTELIEESGIERADKLNDEKVNGEMTEEKGERLNLIARFQLGDCETPPNPTD